MAQSLVIILGFLAHVRKILIALNDTEQSSTEEHSLFIERFDELVTLLQENAEESRYLGQEMMGQFFLRYPQVAHLMPRELLWFFGGDCLHFMADEEIVLFQQLEDLQYQAICDGQEFDWASTKQKMLEKSS